MTHAIKMFEFGPPAVLRWETVDVGSPASGEVRLRQEAIGVNFVDLMVRDGRFGFTPPLVPGFEAAGIVTAVGKGVTSLKVGDRVGYFFSAGAYAEERIINEDVLVKLPDDITARQGAMFLATGLTSWMALRALHEIRAGQTVLVMGASGSVGSVLSRWALHAGARVIGLAGSAGKLAKVARGATVALVADDPGVLARIREHAPDGVDVVFDLVGAAGLDVTAAAVRDGGTIVAIGAASGQAQYPLGDLARRGVTVRQGGTPQYIDATTRPQATEELFDLIRQGVFADLDAEVFPLSDARRAHEAMEHRSLTGLPVLEP